MHFAIWNVQTEERIASKFTQVLEKRLLVHKAGLRRYLMWLMRCGLIPWSSGAVRNNIWPDYTYHVVYIVLGLEYFLAFSNSRFQYLHETFHLLADVYFYFNKCPLPHVQLKFQTPHLPEGSQVESGAQGISDQAAPAKRCWASEHQSIIETIWRSGPFTTVRQAYHHRYDLMPSDCLE